MKFSKVDTGEIGKVSWQLWIGQEKKRFSNQTKLLANFFSYSDLPEPNHIAVNVLYFYQYR